MKKETISIKSFNPYEYRFPNRKVLTLGEVHLIKELKAKGFNVDILPMDHRPVDYIFRKGESSSLEFLWPFVLILWQELPKEIILSTISDWYRKTFFQSKNLKAVSESAASNIVIIENFNGSMYNLNGSALEPLHTAKKLTEIQDLQESYRQSFLTKSANDHLPTPIFRQHSPQIIGWAKISINEIGMHIDDSIITDKQAWNDVKSKKLKGFSVAGIATKSICNICNSSYVICEHVSGQEYYNVECYNAITAALFVECSLVEQPSYSECMVEIIANQLSQSNDQSIY
ncbi:hypothetical protein Dfri01_59130 [Dyadobacter frigoris]|uniref:hypothetical protein n=1 Tax=Dyadobacter frigoris TaxID=2576211 RepID=UPI0024A18EDD|nr:hypothetical protein [Dyadobacter frigoris]GLU56452.1 hypothetical protein Dfri01_59130 [Dyadobacter frigoris]